MYPGGEGWFALEDIDLTGVKSINVISGWQDAPQATFEYEVRLDTPEGQSIGKGSVEPKKGQPMGIAAIKIQPVTDGQFHKLYIAFKPQNVKGSYQAAASAIQFSSK